MRGTILVVDDEPAILEYAAEVLEGCGYSVLKTADGANALVLLRSNREIDLLFTDLVMPEIDGIELVRQAREEYRISRCCLRRVTRPVGSPKTRCSKSRTGPDSSRARSRLCWSQRNDEAPGQLSLHLEQRPRDDIDRPEQSGGKGDRNLRKLDCSVAAANIVPEVVSEIDAGHQPIKTYPDQPDTPTHARLFRKREYF